MIGKLIKYMRNKNGLNQEKLSKILGIERTTLSGYETERREITFKTLLNIAEACNYKIIFKNEIEEFEIKDIIRKD